MLPESEKLRTIIEEDRFRRELQQIIPRASEADDFVAGAKWALARSPEIGRRIGTSVVWFLAMRNKPNLFPVVLYYTFDGETVNLLSIVESMNPIQE